MGFRYVWFNAKPDLPRIFVFFSLLVMTKQKIYKRPFAVLIAYLTFQPGISLACYSLPDLVKISNSNLPINEFTLNTPELEMPDPDGGGNLVLVCDPHQGTWNLFQKNKDGSRDGAVKYPVTLGEAMQISKFDPSTGKDIAKLTIELSLLGRRKGTGIENQPFANKPIVLSSAVENKIAGDPEDRIEVYCRKADDKGEKTLSDVQTMELHIYRGNELVANIEKSRDTTAKSGGFVFAPVAQTANDLIIDAKADRNKKHDLSGCGGQPTKKKTSGSTL